MELTPEQRLQFKLFCQKITEAPRRIEDQPHDRDGAFMMCEDWEMIEVCKFLFNGREAYAGDPPPNRLKGNPLFSKDAVDRAASAVWTLTGGNVELIISGMKQRREQIHVA